MDSKTLTRILEHVIRPVMLISRFTLDSYVRLEGGVTDSLRARNR